MISLKLFLYPQFSNLPFIDFPFTYTLFFLEILAETTTKNETMTNTIRNTSRAMSCMVHLPLACHVYRILIVVVVAVSVVCTISWDTCAYIMWYNFMHIYFLYLNSLYKVNHEREVKENNITSLLLLLLYIIKLRETTTTYITQQYSSSTNNNNNNKKLHDREIGHLLNTLTIK